MLRAKPFSTLSLNKLSKGFMMGLSLVSFLSLTTMGCGESRKIEQPEDPSQPGPRPQVSPDGNFGGHAQGLQPGNGDEQQAQGDQPRSSSQVGNQTAPLVFNVSEKGRQYDEVEVTTRDTLKVRFQPEPAKEPVTEDHSFIARYSRLAVKIRVGEREEMTYLLRNGVTGSKQQSKIYDFSGAISHICEDEGQDCREEVQIELGDANYDFVCFNQTLNAAIRQKCIESPGWTYVSEKHPWFGKIQVQTNDTKPLPEEGGF